jgi:uncharacterized protein
MKLRFLALVVSASALVVSAAGAVDNGGPIDEAMKAGRVGEQANGFLGFVSTPTPAQADLQRRVNEVNIRRRAVYTNVAKDSGETIDRVAVLQALRQISKAEPGEFFRDTTGAWCAKGPQSDIRQAPDDTIVIRCTGGAPQSK